MATCISTGLLHLLQATCVELSYSFYFNFRDKTESLKELTPEEKRALKAKENARADQNDRSARRRERALKICNDASSKNVSFQDS